MNNYYDPLSCFHATREPRDKYYYNEYKKTVKLRLETLLQPNFHKKQLHNMLVEKNFYTAVVTCFDDEMTPDLIFPHYVVGMTSFGETPLRTHFLTDIDEYGGIFTDLTKDNRRCSIFNKFVVFDELIKAKTYLKELPDFLSNPGMFKIFAINYDDRMLPYLTSEWSGTDMLRLQDSLKAKSKDRFELLAKYYADDLTYKFASEIVNQIKDEFGIDVSNNTIYKSKRILSFSLIEEE